ncbi:MAG: pyridoxamine 5'-phosphate oxidase family protein [Chloroflexota bacterium]
MSEIVFSDVIETMDALREIIGQPAQRSLDKVQTEIDELSAAWIAASPFVLIATSDTNGNLDVSPKGDPAGFVQVLDRKTLLIPDRPGNRRIDTLGNILQHPKVGLIFLVPGKQETLRVNGRARIVRDAALRERFAVNGKLPALLIAVTAEEVYVHCAKCVIRSGLWENVESPLNDAVPTLAEMLIVQAKMDGTLEEVQALLDKSYTETLY